MVLTTRYIRNIAHKDPRFPNDILCGSFNGLQFQRKARKTKKHINKTTGIASFVIIDEIIDLDDFEELEEE